MSSLVKSETNLQELDISNLPLKVYFDEESGSIIIDSEYNIVIKSKGNIISSADGKHITLGEEIHLNPSTDVINKDKISR